MRGAAKVAVIAGIVAALALIVGAVWAPYGEWPQGQLGWTGVIVGFTALFAAPFTFI